MNPQIRLALSFACVALALPAATATRTETRNLTGFTGLSVAAPIEVELTLGERESVVLEGDEEMLAKLETYVENGSLHIRRKREDPDWKFGRKQEMRARITAKRIDAISIAGSGDVHAAKLSGDSLSLSISGSGDIAVDGGKVGQLAVSIAGSGDVKAVKLDAQAVSVHISGSGNAFVWARQSLAVQVAGSGDVRYYGDPAVSRSVVGSGSVKRLGPAPA
jgi:hypothetical protein